MIPAMPEPRGGVPRGADPSAVIGFELENSSFNADTRVAVHFGPHKKRAFYLFIRCGWVNLMIIELGGSTGRGSSGRTSRR